jgi:hypothetical protein
VCLIISDLSHNERLGRRSPPQEVNTPQHRYPHSFAADLLAVLTLFAAFLETPRGLDAGAACVSALEAVSFPHALPPGKMKE